MLDKPLELLQESDLQQLVSDKVEEGKTIDYKSSLPGGKDDDRREFLADVSSFANTVGGHLIYGIKEMDSIPTEIIGVTPSGWESQMLQLESVIRTGIAPAITCHLQTVVLSNDNRVLIVRIGRSWNAPHRVTYKGYDKFYARNSKGKFPLDVDQLRMAFAASGDMESRIKALRSERLLAIAQDRTPVPMRGVGKMVAHLIPASSMGPFSESRAWSARPNHELLRPLGSSSWSNRRNYEGFLTYNGGRNGPTNSYIQLFHSGIIEAVVSNIVHNPQRPNREMLYSMVYEEQLLASLPYLLDFQKKLNLETPIYLYIAVVGCDGALMKDEYFIRDLDDYTPIDREVMDLPGAVIDAFDIDPSTLLKPVFDVAWQACGFEQSLNFDAEGTWHGR